VTPEQYAAAQALITAKATGYVASITQFFLGQALNPRAWLKFLELLFPQVQQARFDSARLARAFNDSQRKAAYPDLPRQDRNIEAYDFRQFITEMEPARVRMSMPESPPDAKVSMQLLVARTVETGGRRQIIKAVEDDTDLEEKLLDAGPADSVEYNLSGTEKVTGGGPVLGWARIATGKETCAWCLMLVSRGPVYSSAIKAGLKLDDIDAADVYAMDDPEMRTMMDEWHPGCDCKVIPVYDYNNWAGRYESERALVLWNKASKEARRTLSRYQEEGREKMYFSRKHNAWLPTTLNREAQNVLRRQLSAGDIQMRELTAAAA
jgi:hypothetical protein